MNCAGPPTYCRAALPSGRNFAENVRGRPSRDPGHGPELADDYSEVMELWQRCREESLEIYRGLGTEDLTRPLTTPAGAPSAPGSGPGPWWSTSSTTGGSPTCCSGWPGWRRRPSTS